MRPESLEARCVGAEPSPPSFPFPSARKACSRAELLNNRGCPHRTISCPEFVTQGGVGVRLLSRRLGGRVY